MPDLANDPEYRLTRRQADALMRCPSCRGTGKPLFSGNYTECPECNGSGALDTARRWLQAWCFVAGRVGAFWFLLLLWWAVYATMPAIALVGLLSMLGIGDTWDWFRIVFQWLTILFATGAL